MKTKDFLDDIKKLSAEKLAEKKRELKEELMKLRFQAASGKLEKGHVVKQIRRNIARVETVLSTKSK